MSDENRKPDWWLANERDRESLDLPAYEPPRFEDDVYVHEVVSDIESTYDCEIAFLGINVDYPDEWTVRIDGTDAFSVGRSRDERGNTVYRIESDEFAAEVTAVVSGGNDRS